MGHVHWVRRRSIAPLTTRSVRQGWIALGAAIALGCTIPKLELAGKSCPCTKGFTCDRSTDLCVRTKPGDELDAGLPKDAEPDGDLPDAEPNVPCAELPTSELLADDFEDTDSPFKLGPISSSSCKVDRSHSESFHGGERSLRVVTPGAGETASLEGFFTPTTRCGLVLKAALFIDSAVALRGFTALSLTGQGSDRGIHIKFVGPGMKLGVDPATTDPTLQDPDKVVGRWIELELRVQVGTAGKVALYLDGTELINQAMNTALTPGYARLRLGVVAPQSNQGAVNILVDDVRLERQGEPFE